METDFAVLAARIATDSNGVRGCIITSRDGMVLGAHPAGAEESVKSAWLRFSALGEAEKGFLQFAGELWVSVTRGPYSVFAVANTTVRAGLLLDQIDQALLAAAEARAKQDVRIPESPSIPSGPRAPLHPEARPVAPQPQSLAPVAEPAAHPPAASVSSSGQTTPAPSISPEPEHGAEESGPSPDGSGEVDRVGLAAEFARLLEESGYDEDE